MDFFKGVAGLIFKVIGDTDAAKKRKAEVEKALKDNALSCKKCGRLAEPIIGTRRNYRCECGHQFSAAVHDL